MHTLQIMLTIHALFGFVGDFNYMILTLYISWLLPLNYKVFLTASKATLKNKSMG